MQIKRAIFLVLVSFPSVASKIYEISSKKVDFTIEYLDEYGSQTACVEKLEGFTDPFKTVCFSRELNERGIVTDCQGKFDNTTCNKCDICETNDDEVGFILDCFNVEPTENVNQCAPFLNASIQTVLVDEYFASMPFDFGMNETATSDGNGDAQSSGNLSTLSLKGFNFMILTVALAIGSIVCVL